MMLFESHKTLKELNTFGIDVTCDLFSTFKSTEDLVEIFNSYQQKEYLILGGGSNVLFTKNFKGLILKNRIEGIRVVEDQQEYALVEVGGGETWHNFVMWAIEKDLGGIENLSLIPGSAGAAPMQNIGAYGVEIKDVFHSLKAFKIDTQEEVLFDKETCDFGYRESIFKNKAKNQYIITNVCFKLKKKGFHELNSSYGMIEEELKASKISSPTIRDISNAVIAIRKRKLPDPKEIGNSGSFFKNPILPNSVINELKKRFENIPVYPIDAKNSKTAAGWLIEQAGWKGFTKGSFGVHKNQALVLVNYGGASGSEIYELSQQIINSVKEKFGIELEREVNIY